jgi:hypothetical protein
LVSCSDEIFCRALHVMVCEAVELGQVPDVMLTSGMLSCVHATAVTAVPPDVVGAFTVVQLPSVVVVAEPATGVQVTLLPGAVGVAATVQLERPLTVLDVPATSVHEVAVFAVPPPVVGGFTTVQVD